MYHRLSQMLCVSDTQGQKLIIHQAGVGIDQILQVAESRPCGRVPVRITDQHRVHQKVQGDIVTISTFRHTTCRHVETQNQISMVVQLFKIWYRYQFRSTSATCTFHSILYKIGYFKKGLFSIKATVFITKCIYLYSFVTIFVL